MGLLYEQNLIIILIMKLNVLEICKLVCVGKGREMRIKDKLKVCNNESSGDEDEQINRVNLVVGIIDCSYGID